MLLSGVVAASAMTPTLDRIFTHYLKITPKVLCLFIGISWPSLVGAGKEVIRPFLRRQ